MKIVKDISPSILTSVRGGSECLASNSDCFLDPGANAELVLKFDVALHSSYAALPMLNENLTLLQPFQR
jgi:hypothetical protein